MATHWNSTADLVDDLNIDASPDNTEEIKRQIRARVMELHPDRNNGDFPDTKSKLEFERLVDALSTLQKLPNTKPLSPTAETPLATFNSQNQWPAIATESYAASIENTAHDRCNASIRHTYLTPRITSGVFSAICGFLASFGTMGGSIGVAPLSWIYQSTAFQLALWLLAGAAGMAFIFTWIEETRDKSFIDAMMSESGLRRAIAEFMKSRYGVVTSHGTVVTIGSLAEVIWESSRRPWSLFPHLPRSRAIPWSAAENIAKAHISRLESRGALRPTNSPSLEATYYLPEEIAHSTEML